MGHEVVLKAREAQLVRGRIPLGYLQGLAGKNTTYLKLG